MTQFVRDEEQVYKTKAFMFDNGITVEEIDKAWLVGIDAGNKILKSFSDAGMEAIDLPVHLIKDLIVRYSP